MAPTLPSHEKYLFIASTGGHLEQLKRISELINASAESHWITFESEQSRAVLAQSSKTFVEYIGPRAILRTIKAIPTLVREIRRQDWEAVVSTGAAIAVPSLFLAPLLGKRAVYIESVSRFEGPSLTGKILEKAPWVTVLAQHSSWLHGRWKNEFSLLDSFNNQDTSGLEKCVVEAKNSELKRILVTLGTISPYRFDSLIDSVLRATSGRDIELIWQYGCTTRDDLPGESYAMLPSKMLDGFIESSDLIITHGGVATCLKLAATGKPFIVSPRRKVRSEHVDDHQEQIAEALAAKGICTMMEASEVTWNAMQKVHHRSR